MRVITSRCCSGVGALKRTACNQKHESSAVDISLDLQQRLPVFQSTQNIDVQVLTTFNLWSKAHWRFTEFDAVTQ